MVVTVRFDGTEAVQKATPAGLKSPIRPPYAPPVSGSAVAFPQRHEGQWDRQHIYSGIYFLTTFSDMENTQENPTSQNPTSPEDAGRPAAAAGPADASQGQQPGAENAGAAAEAVLAEAQAKIAELQESFLRAKAETENVRRRAQEDVSKAHKFAIESFAEHLLPVVDSLEAAMAHESDDIAKVREGIELTLRQLTGALEKGRVLAVNPVGEKFDPHRHQAISMVPADQEANTVVSVLQKGYTIADRVLRPALVTVAQPK
jgi:molecular chaperone GrpE